MNPTRITCLAALSLCLCSIAQAQVKSKAPQVCAWIVETKDADKVHQFDLWLEADAEVDFLYVIGGAGVITPSGKSHSPSSGTYNLSPHKAEKPWGYGTSVNSSAKIDITVDLRQTPTDIFSKVQTPLLAKFLFRRDIPESEKAVPPIFAKRQCAPLSGAKN
jgi:hypothetical protein